MPPTIPFLLRDPVSSASHLLFAIWMAYSTILLRRLARGDRVKRIIVTVFGLSAVLLYAVSGVYHTIPASEPRLIELFLRLDLGAIHVLIAGTVTPLFAVFLTRRLARVLLLLVWSLALLGLAVRLLLPPPSFLFSLALYVALAAVGFLPVVRLARALGARGMAWLAGGCLAYLTGAASQALRWPVLLPGVIGPHEILHFTDMLGTSCHLVLVGRFVLSSPLPAGGPADRRP